MDSLHWECYLSCRVPQSYATHGKHTVRFKRVFWMRERSNGKHKTTGSLRTEITAIVLWSWSICVKYYCISSNQFMSRAGLPSLLLSVTAGHARNELEVRSPVTVPSWVTQSHKRARSHRASQWLTKHHSSAIQRCVRVDSCVVHSCLCPFTCRISLLNDCRMHWLNRCTVLSSSADDSYPTSCWLPHDIQNPHDSCTNSCDSMDMLRTSLWILPGSQCRCCPTVMSGETSRPQFKHSWHAWHKLKHKSEFLLGALSRARGLHMREKDGSTLYTILYWISENSTSIWSMYPFVFVQRKANRESWCRCPRYSTIIAIYTSATLHCWICQFLPKRAASDEHTATET